LREQCPVSFETLSPSSGRWVEVRACPTPQGLAVNFRDIDERKQMEGELQHALAELHAREEQLRESQRQVSHLAHLVDDLLDISRITHGSVELKREKILLTEVLASAVESSRPYIEAQAHKLVIDVRPTAPVIIEGDRQRLAQIFANLLANSAKYTDREGTITLTLDCEGSEAVVSASSQGPGTGSVFTVRLPVVQKALAALATGPAPTRHAVLSNVPNE
jgi:signal transduction histidine kinase